MAEETEARDRAAMRWIGIEAANTCPGLSPAARRVLIALINAMDANTFACFPSEVRLAATLDMSMRSIKAAKEELREMGMISWITHGGPRHLCRYTLNWSGLVRLAELAKNRAEKAVQNRTYQPTKMPTFGAKNRQSKGANSAAGCTIKGAADCTVNSAAGCTFEEDQGAVCSTQGAVGCTPKVQPASPELSHYPSSLTTQPLVGACALESAAPHVSQNVSRTDEAEAEEALEEEAARPGFATVYPKIWAAFEDDNEAIGRLARFDHNALHRVSAALAMKGKGAAHAIVMGANQ